MKGDPNLCVKLKHIHIHTDTLTRLSVSLSLLTSLDWDEDLLELLRKAPIWGRLVDKLLIDPDAARLDSSRVASVETKLFAASPEDHTNVLIGHL